MSENLWSIIFTFGGTTIGSIVTYFLTRAKYKTEVDSNRITNFDSSIQAYKKMYEDMIEDLKTQNKDLKEEVNSLKQELNKNREQILTLTNLFLVSAMQGQNEKASPEAMQKLMEFIKYGSEVK